MSLPDPIPEPAERPSVALDDTASRRRLRRLRPLPLWLRVLIFMVGWIVVLVGIAGLVLPGPGIVTIVVGAAILSVGSEVAYEWTRRNLRRWPSVRSRFEGLRERLHDKLHDLVHRD